MQDKEIQKLKLEIKKLELELAIAKLQREKEYIYIPQYIPQYIQPLNPYPSPIWNTPIVPYTPYEFPIVTCSTEC